MIGLVAGRFKARWHGVLVSFVVNFGALAYFKYANFGLENARAALELLGFRVEVPRVTWCCRSGSASTSSSPSPT